MLRKVLLASALASILSGCATKAQIESAIYTQNSPLFASNVCFDIGSGINSNAITDDYMAALGVETPIACTYSLASRTSLSEKEKTQWLIDSLSISSDKDFLSKETLLSIKQSLAALQQKLAAIENKEAEELAALEQKRLKEQAILEEEAKKREAEYAKIAAKRKQQEIELCGINGLTVGDSEACLLHVKAVYAYDKETTETLNGKDVFYRFFNLQTEKWEYAHVVNGIVVSLRY